MFGRGLVSKIRARFGRGKAGAAIGRAFTPDMEADWPELEEQVDGSLKKVGSSVVASWEVATTELARLLVGAEGEKAAIERFSDAVVPTLSAFQDLHKGCPSAMQEGLRTGKSTGDLAQAAVPLLKLVAGLDKVAADGWVKTADYLGPIFARTADADGAREAFLLAGPELARACRDADTILRDTLAKMPLAPTLYSGVCDAFDAWQLALTRELEIILDRHTKVLLAAVKAGR